MNGRTKKIAKENFTILNKCFLIDLLVSWSSLLVMCETIGNYERKQQDLRKEV